jgi:unsaturated chondroitin disaccharide hydrolase
MPIIGGRNPKVGTADLDWEYCQPGDWVSGFLCGQYWLAYHLTGDSVFANSARLRYTEFRDLLTRPTTLDHDLGFQFSLSAVADWTSTGNGDARALALEAADCLFALYRPNGQYIQAWVPNGEPGHAEFVAGRMIADTMQNVALLFWAGKESRRHEFTEAALNHCRTSWRRICRDDGTAFHTYRFEPQSGKPIGGETHQGYADDSCWSRGQGWLLHGFAQSYQATGEADLLLAARQTAATVERLLVGSVPRWDYSAPAAESNYLDSSAGAITAAGLYLLAESVAEDERERWITLADRMLGGLLDRCDLTRDDSAMGLLNHGAAFVPAGVVDNMLPYGDYYFMEALMRSLGHRQFFW